MKRVFMGSVAGVILLMAGCSTTKPVPVAMSNSDLERAVKAQLSTDPGLRDVSVDANAANNEAKLSGTVTTEGLRTKALDMAKTASPGLVITDKIDVKPVEMARSEYTEDMAKSAREKAKEAGDTIGNAVDDAWIHTKIMTKLATTSETPARHINIDVVDQSVTLRGTVDTAEAKSEAARIAGETDGVKHVRNLLKVRVG